MASRNKKIFWGIILASLHVNLFGLVLFPSCFGFALLYFGLYDLEKGGGRFALTKGQMKLYRAAAAALVLVSGLIGFLAVFRSVPDEGIGSLVPFMLEYIVFYFLMEVYVSMKPSLNGLKRGYALVMGAALTGYGVSLIFHSGTWQVFCGVIILVCRIMVLVAVMSDKAVEEAESSTEE